MSQFPDGYAYIDVYALQSSATLPAHHSSRQDRHTSYAHGTHI